ncbi:SnoaL-domain-containing protein [Hypoxylon trugodes]|uniref:SnoaL-domain-containing protein n=1 Tax=Hypoxylon trugodes TaxID=326681 RepID=UPI0021A0780E|nr:SnoaL-domain-containing protein [Hypoxylon trugodes]KAI1384128.1 SnoaL-domain-containing protein [Hypoxylon trugodes]
MSTSAQELVATIRSWLKCVNEKRWDDLPKYMQPSYSQNGIDYTPESWATHMSEHVAPQLGGDVRINEDSIMVDEDAQCVAFSVWLKFKPEIPLFGYQPKGRDVLLVEHGFIWFTHGKLSKALFLINNDDMRKQLASPNSEYVPSLISEYLAPRTDAPLPREKLEELYRGYVDTVNFRRTATDYAKYVDQPEMLLNNGAPARNIVEDTLAAIPDLHVEIETLIADEESQRVAVWLKFTGTPIKEYGGLVANGRSVGFTEHATYQFVNGKIQRIWGVMDLDEARQQQTQNPIKQHYVSVL